MSCFPVDRRTGDFSMGGYNNVDTTGFRTAIWNYIQALFGIRHDDYDYSSVSGRRPLVQYPKYSGEPAAQPGSEDLHQASGSEPASSAGRVADEHHVRVQVIREGPFHFPFPAHWQLSICRQCQPRAKKDTPSFCNRNRGKDTIGTFYNCLTSRFMLS